MSPAEALKDYRTRHGLTQADLARLLPVSIKTLQNWEGSRPKKTPPDYLPRALADLERELSATRE